MANNEDFVEIVGQRVDDLVNMDVPARNATRILYPLAREKIRGPLCLTAAKLLRERTHQGEVVFIATGFPDRPHINITVAETDGPLGAAALARALHWGLRAVPVILVEEQLVASMSCVTGAAGFRVLPSPEEAIAAISSFSALHAAAVISFPNDVAKAKERAQELIEKYKPTGVVVIEKAGMNEKGVCHGSRGDSNDAIAKIDYLVLEAIKEKITTIGIGDGGNELGMGVIQEELKKTSIPYMAKCNCGCGGGIAPATRTDVLITAAVSNWGAYGIAACLALLLKSPEVLHDALAEEAMLQEAARVSFIDGATGYVMPPAADGLKSAVHQAFVTLLREIVVQGLGFMEKGAIYMRSVPKKGG